MNPFRKTIFTGFAPNISFQDVRISLSFLFLPWKWPRLWRGRNVEKAEQWLKQFFGVGHAVTFDSGRSGLTLALRALDVGPGYDVLVQAYTCIVVVNAIQATGANPIFVDTKDNFFMDPVDAEEKITPKTKAIIIQHTFGMPADMDRLLSIAQAHRLKVVEDCAHTIGGMWHGRYLGTFGNVGMLSFGTDKVISCVRGGAIITNDPAVAERLQAMQRELPQMSMCTLFRHLLHGPVFFLAKPLYHLGIGKIILWFAKHLGIVARIISDREKRGEPDTGFPCRLPNALAALLVEQGTHIQENLSHRKRISMCYRFGIVENPKVETPEPEQDDTYYLRYPILTNNPKNLRAFAKTQGILLGDWYDAVVAPCKNGCAHIGYAPGTCPHAEATARGSINLPTDISISPKDAERIIECLNRYV